MAETEVPKIQVDLQAESKGGKMTEQIQNDDLTQKVEALVSAYADVVFYAAEEMDRGANSLVADLVELLETPDVSLQAVEASIREAYTRKRQDQDRGPFPDADTLLADVREQVTEDEKDHPILEGSDAFTFRKIE